MKCLVINLRRAVERKQYISNQLNQVSQEFEFVAGVDWKEIDASLQPVTARHIKIKNSFRSLSMGEIGCNLSHRKILKWLASSSEKMIAVLEDDVRISKDFPEAITVLAETHCKFDIVFLGSDSQKGQLTNLIPLSNKFHLSLRSKRDTGAWGYVITRQAAQKFLKIFPEITGPIDDALHAYYVHGLKTFTLNPQIVFHEEEAKKNSYNLEKTHKKKFKEKIMNFPLKYYEKYVYKVHFLRRRGLEKLENNTG
ncbi:MAG: glycosyltransferase family 25 protein [Paracoccaceae bacterium]|nr:glycosyltransferase family 25 protein [Paracoccaceae bacterium]